MKLKRLLTPLNSPNNKDGSKIRVILGSNIISEGFSFKNIQMVIIQTPHWNYSRLTQAIARGYRTGSHTDLINNKNLQIQIYQQASIPRGEDAYNKSIDIKMYKDSETKDVKIKKMERVVMESAFDLRFKL